MDLIVPPRNFHTIILQFWRYLTSPVTLFNRPAALNWYWDVPSPKFLYIDKCELSGPFPDELGNLTVLEGLDMGWNKIEGMIPATLKNLCSLQSVYLAGNIIGGDVTDLIERLPNCSWNSLQELNLFEANITGTTLKSVLNLTALSILYLQENHLSGYVPVEIGTLKYLTYLHFGGNSLSGVISETHFSGLTNLKSIDFSHNYLQVKVDSDWIPPFDLDRAYLSSCHLGPQIPNWLRWQKSISELEMSDAGLIGRIPDWFWTTSGFLMTGSSSCSLRVSGSACSRASPRVFQTFAMQEDPPIS